MNTSSDIMEFGYTSELSIFKPSLLDTGVQKVRWIPYKPVTQMERGIEFVINNNSSAYIDLARTSLNLQVQVLKEDGTALPELGKGLDVADEASEYRNTHKSGFNHTDIHKIVMTFHFVFYASIALNHG